MLSAPAPPVIVADVRVLGVLAIALATATAAASASAMSDPDGAAHACKAGFRHAIVGGKHRCLKAGQRCQRRYDAQYHRYGFHCHGARLTRNRPPAGPPRADLALAVTDSPDPAAVGGELTYTITVTNAGPANAGRVVAGTEQLAEEINGGQLQLVRVDGPCNVSLGVVACVLSVPNGGTATGAVVLRPTAPGTVTAEWVAGPSDFLRTEDRNVENNHVEVSTTVR